MVDYSMFAPIDVVGAYSRGLQAREQRDEMNDRRRLKDLLPGAVHGDRQAIDEIAGINPELFMKLDDRQRAQAQAELADITGAVRWADTPQKWQQVQQFYAAHGHDLSAYPFESRESSLLALGKIGEYLNSAPKNEATTLQRNYEFLQRQNPALAQRYLQNEAEGPQLVVDNGDGTKTVYPHGIMGTAPSGGSGGGGIPSSAIDYLKAHPDTAPQFDQKYGAGASQRVMGGQMGSGPSGGFL